MFVMFVMVVLAVLMLVDVLGGARHDARLVP